jgi:pimeloyl-ACP methyl ester carboxylesterase
MLGGPAVPYANNQGVRIYYEVRGFGLPLVLHHGTLGTGRDWNNFGYTSVLAHKHQLLLIDARGHGRSEKPDDPNAYHLPLRVADVTAVLDNHGIGRVDYFGYSMGGWVGFGLAKHAPDRLHSLILGGTHAFAEEMKLSRDFMPREPEAFLAYIESVFGSYLTPAIRGDLMANDLDAVLASMRDRPSLADVLPTISLPCLLYSGEFDPRLSRIQECLQGLDNGTFFSLPECDHLAAFARSDLVLPHATAFLAKVSQDR